MLCVPQSHDVSPLLVGSIKLKLLERLRQRALCIALSGQVELTLGVQDVPNLTELRDIGLEIPIERVGQIPLHI
ncbi:hypothetical protein DEMA109039_20585 [Deinococcus marmoris]